MALSGSAAAVLGAASGVNAMLRGQIRGEMMRQQEAMARAQQVGREQQLMFQRDQLASLRQQQRAALELEYKQLAESIRARQGREALEASGQQVDLDIANMKSSGGLMEGAWTEERAIELERKQRESALEAFDSDVSNYVYENGAFTALKPGMAERRAQLVQGLDPQDIARKGRENYSSYTGPARTPGGSIKLGPKAQGLAVKIDAKGVSPADIVSELLDAKGNQSLTQEFGLTPALQDELFRYYTERAWLDRQR